jgi:hypothetical protein
VWHIHFLLLSQITMPFRFSCARASYNQWNGEVSFIQVPPFTLTRFII